MHELTIIDNDRQFVSNFSSYLAKHNNIQIKITTITETEAAMMHLRIHSPAVVIINAKIENKDGLDIIRRCNTVKSPVKFIVINEEKDFDVLYESLHLEVCDFFTKPVDFALLNDSVNRIFSTLEKKTPKHSEDDVRPMKDRMFSDLLSGRIKNPVELTLRLAEAEMNPDHINCPCALINIHINSFSRWLTMCWDDGAERFYRELRNVLCNCCDKAEFIIARTFYSNIEVLCINNSQLSTETVLKECIAEFSKIILDKLGVYSEIHVTKIFSSLTEIMKYNLQEPINIDIKSDEVIENAVKYLRHNYFREITLDDVSKYVKLSKEYFCTFYKKNTGENFLDTLTRHRINMSERLLINTTLTVGQVAESVGYRSVSYFHKTFKNLCGISPSEYRKLHTSRNQKKV